MRSVKRVVRYAAGLRDHEIWMERGSFNPHSFKLDVLTLYLGFGVTNRYTQSCTFIDCEHGYYSVRPVNRKSSL